MSRIPIVLGAVLCMAGVAVAQETCPQQLQQFQYEASINDNQRGAAVRDLAKANRIITELRAHAMQLDKELTKMKEDVKKATEAKPKE